MFDHILNWKLLAGTHDFPGPDGGTCINEVAIVAAGFEYQAVICVDEMPPCFSRPIAALAMALNDILPDEQRQRLIKYVYQLAGTADDRVTEISRSNLINRLMIQGMRRIVSDITHPLFEGWREEWMDVLSDEPERTATSLLAEFADELKVQIYLPDSLLQVIFTKKELADEIFEHLAQLGMDVLDAALAVGNRATPIDVNMVEQRLEKAKVTA
jgi:hypothetical protein